MKRVVVATLMVLALTLVGFAAQPSATRPTTHPRREVPVLRVAYDPSSDLGGRYMRDGSHRPVVWLNTAPGKNAHGLRWTYRHELGHAQADYLHLPPSEDYANAVADGLIPLRWPRTTEPPLTSVLSARASRTG